MTHCAMMPDSTICCAGSASNEGPPGGISGAAADARKDFLGTDCVAW